MKILHVYKDYSPILGGIENHVHWLATGQATRGHDVTVLVTNPQRQKTTERIEEGVKVIRAARLATVASTPLSLALPRHLAQQTPDIVHLHFPYPVGEVSQWGLRRGNRTVMTYHSDVVRQTSIMRFYRPLLKRVLASVDAFVVGSPPMAESNYLAPYRDRIHFIPYGLPLQRFTAIPEPADMSRIRERYLGGRALDAATPLLLFVGRLRYYKGLDVLLRALVSLDAELAVAGDGPMGEAWRALADTLGVAGKVRWLGDVDGADLPCLYHAADLFVLPASHTSEAFGFVQVEAMAAGLPVISTELGTGTSYVNRDRVTGRVVPANDPGALASAIGALWSDPEGRRRMGRAAADRVTAEFGIEAMVDRVLELYGRLLAA